MRMQIKEFAEYTGVSVRTLHYYDEIGLLRPACVDPQTGYRFYDEDCLLRMQEILFYRELDFPLKRIGALLSSPRRDRGGALLAQKQLLTLKKERLERLIAAIDGAVKGEPVMQAFDNSSLEAYRAEAKERWGGTAAYQAYEQQTKNDSDRQRKEAAEGLDRLMGEFALCMKSENAPDSQEAQALVGELQRYITKHYYPCTDEILAGLGQMYAADERFRENIDRHADGTAAFIRDAVELYCAKQRSL